MEEINIIRKVEAIISAGEEVSVCWLHEPSRGRRYVVQTKQIIQYFARTAFHLPYSFIGAYYGRDHATAENSEKVINNLCLYDKNLRDKIKHYGELLSEGMPGLYNIAVIKILQDGVKTDYNDLKRRFDEVGELIKKVVPYEVV